MTTTVFCLTEITISPAAFFAFLAVTGVVLLMARIYFASRQPDSPDSRNFESNHVPSQANLEIIEEIRKISNAEELMDLVSVYEWLEGEENKLLLAKALEFEPELDQDDWAEIYRIAEDGSELERVAGEKAGDLLG